MNNLDINKLILPIINHNHNLNLNLNPGIHDYKSKYIMNKYHYIQYCDYCDECNCHAGMTKININQSGGHGHGQGLSQDQSKSACSVDDINIDVDSNDSCGGKSYMNRYAL